MKITVAQLKQLIREQLEEMKRPKRPSPGAIWNDAWGRWYGIGAEPRETPEEAAANHAKDIKKAILAVVAEQSAYALPHKQYADIIRKVAKEVALKVGQRPPYRWYEDDEAMYTPEEADFAGDIKEAILTVVFPSDEPAYPFPHKQYADIILKAAKEVALKVARRPDK